MRPEPFVPPETDLRDLPSMLLDIDRLLNSDFNAGTNDRAWRAGVTLWLKSFRQLPASSLPADDVSLGGLAGYGREMRAWAKDKSQIMRHWTLCSDGRLYHHVVAEKALIAWIDRLTIRNSSRVGNARRWQHAYDPQVIGEQIERARAALRALEAGRNGGHPSPDGNPSAIPTGVPMAIPARSRRQSQRDPDGSPSSNPGAIPSAIPARSRRESQRQSRRESEAEAEVLYPSRDRLLRLGTTGKPGGSATDAGYGSVARPPADFDETPFGEADDAA